MHMEPGRNTGNVRAPAEGRVVFSGKHEVGEPSLPDLVSSNRSGKFSEASLETIYYTYPLKLLVPEHASENRCQWVYVITYGGGLVEGDYIQVNVEVQNGCAALVTTQSSTKVYHCLEGMVTRQKMTYTIGVDALLAILPDPVVSFQDSIYEQSQFIYMTARSNLIMLDWYTAGRVARGEVWDFTSFKSSTKLAIDGEIVLRDSTNLKDNRNIDKKTALGSYKVVGMCILLGKLLEDTTAQLLTTLGKPKAYGAKYRCDRFVSISPLEYNIRPDVTVKGCIIKVLAQSTAQAFEELKPVLTPLYPVLGGNPFHNKY